MPFAKAGLLVGPGPTTSPGLASMATSSWIRCAHCMSRIETGHAREVGLDLLCETCARLAGAPPASPPSVDVPDEAIPDEWDDSSEQIVEQIWQLVVWSCRKAGHQD